MSEESEFKLNMAKRLILKDLGLEEETIDGIRSNEEAVEVVKYLQDKVKNEAPPTDNKKKMLSLKPNMGHQPDALPDPEDVNERFQMNLREKLDPLSLKHATNNRWKSNARILPIFSDEYPNGRYF